MTTAADVPAMLVQFEARLSLLLQVSNSQFGAGQVLEAGLLQAINESGLFIVDIDVGLGQSYLRQCPSFYSDMILDIDDPTAIKRYHELIASVLRLVVAALIARGAQNEQHRLQIRHFLKDHRTNIVGMFKRHASIGSKANPEMQEILDSIIKSYSALMAMTDFIEVSDQIPHQEASSSLPH